MKKGDIKLIAVILIVIAILFMYKNVIGQSEDKILVITKDNTVLYKIKLTDESNDEIKIGDEDGYNIIKIEKGVVSIIEADCKNNICVKDGFISKAGEALVCLPHKLVVEITGKEDIDIVVK